MVFLIPQELISSKFFVVRLNARVARVDRATDKTKYALGTRLLRLEAGFHSLASGFSEHGIPALRRSGDQHLHVERNSHEPQRVWPGIYPAESLCGHPFHPCWSVHCSLGHSKDIRNRFDADSVWRTVALLRGAKALALLGGFRSAHGGGNQFRHYRSCSNSHHALVQPLSRKNYGGDALGVGICRIHCGADDQSHSNGEWWKLAPSMGDRGRDFRVIRDCRVSVCERTPRRSWPVSGRRSERGAICEDVGCGRPGYEVSVGAWAGLPDPRVLDDPCRCNRVPISVFLSYRPLAAALERSGHSPRGRCIRHGPFHAGSGVWPLDWRLVDGRHGRALRVHAGLLLLFPRVFSGDSSFS